MESSAKAPSGQIATQCPHFRQRNSAPETIEGTASFEADSITWTGQSSMQVPQRVHFSSSIVKRLTLFSFIIFLTALPDDSHYPCVDFSNQADIFKKPE